ncbi:hypothetical protein I6A84_30280 [Frankia sp. CNm7]|uniref:Tetratricopeptide repeat protein n=2 Tax=Frankia nepalensis TaxID=1836974 RepID=A0A937UP10_9ACTN|nr:hypothetical protein [Frankia nepalensis]MBL7510889.1 hypothetical protein [Frankia nepalensis]MBL7522251.1 hypothetical protein [Frankia nepalensis]MBL7630389.1 hypothetical protein [Frankia nepalensis]
MVDPGPLGVALAALPTERHPDYGSQARRLLRELSPTDEQLTALVDDTANPEQIRFNAFYCLQARAWRRKDHTRHRANTDRHQAEFGHHPMFFFMQAEYYASLDEDPVNLEAAMRFAEQAVERLPGVPGVLHLAAEVRADYADRQAVPDRDQLLAADRHVRQAIAISSGTYPRYHATLARICTLRGDFPGARASIARAIDAEDSSDPEYALRLGSYQLIRSRIQYVQETEQLRSRQEEASGELRRIRGQILEIMGLLAAVIALITTAANIASGQSAQAAGGLMALTGGVVLLVFWAFHLLIVDTPSGRRGLAALVLGVMLVVAGWAQMQWGPTNARTGSDQFLVEDVQ